MAWFNKKPDPISDRARALSDEIAELEAQIKQLDARVQSGEAGPRLRSTAVPRGGTVNHSASDIPQEPAGSSAADEPIFEEVDRGQLKPGADSTTTPEHYNELGVRKYDLPALLLRIRNHLRGPSTTNPKLVSYLAAGGIQGLRPLRYERRVARNRFIALVIVRRVALLGIITMFVKHPR
jgi:hypothetical protein